MSMFLRFFVKLRKSLLIICQLTSFAPFYLHFTIGCDIIYRIIQQSAVIDMQMFDTHVHSCYSVDSEQPLCGIYDKAKELGLCALSVTDHYDIDMMYSGCDEQVLTEGYTAINELRNATADNDCKILCGIELGAAVFDESTARRIIDEYDYDIVIGSLHGEMGKDEYYMQPWGKMSETERQNMLCRYFEHLLNTAKLGLFDTLAHLDYPTRYVRTLGLPCDMTPYADLIDEILKTVAASGKALEINTKGLTECYHSTQPSPAVIKRFFELGGKYITFGSDAHTAERIAADFDTAANIARAAGFEYLTYYKQRKPVCIKI